MKTFRISDPGVVQLTVSEFHDILTQQGCLYNEDEESVGVTKFELIRDPDLSDKDFAAISALTERLVDLMQQIRETDSDFHDICELYC